MHVHRISYCNIIAMNWTVQSQEMNFHRSSGKVSLNVAVISLTFAWRTFLNVKMALCKMCKDWCWRCWTISPQQSYSSTRHCTQCFALCHTEALTLQFCKALPSSCCSYRTYDFQTLKGSSRNNQKSKTVDPCWKNCVVSTVRKNRFKTGHSVTMRFVDFLNWDQAIWMLKKREKKNASFLEQNLWNYDCNLERNGESGLFSAKHQAISCSVRSNTIGASYVNITDEGSFLWSKRLKKVRNSSEEKLWKCWASKAYW